MTMKFRVYEGYGRMVAFYDKTDSNGETVIGSIQLLPPRDAASKIRGIRLVGGK